MRFLRRLVKLDLLGEVIVIAQEQQAVISDQRRIITQKTRELEEMRLESARSTRDLVEQFWICQEGGIDVREPLLIGLQDMRDQVARLEEHGEY